MVHGMVKSTVRIPTDVKRALERIAAARSVNVAELICQALRRFAAEAAPPRPRLPLFRSGKPRLAEEIDVALCGFERS